MNLARAAPWLALAFAAVAGLWALWPASASPPVLLEGLKDDGLRAAPCPARTLYEQDARKKQGVLPQTGLGRRLRERFPLGSEASALRQELAREGFSAWTPCANDEGVFGARWLSQDWGQPDAYIFWRADGGAAITFLDGHVSRAP